MPARVAVAVLAGLLACGLPLWPIPYSDVNLLENPSPGLWLFLGGLAGLLAGYLIRPSVRIPVASVTGGFLMALLGRVAIETAMDPTSHNLWPFEVVIVGAVGLVSALLGVRVARLIQRLRPRP